MTAGASIGALPHALRDEGALLAAADPEVLVTSLDDVDLDALAEGRLAHRDA